MPVLVCIPERLLIKDYIPYPAQGLWGETMGWLHRLDEGLKRVVFRLSPLQIFVVVAFLLLGLGIVIVSLVTEITRAYYAYFVLAGIALALFITRTIEPWEWGIELYNLINFCVAFVFGPVFALLLNFVTFLLFPVTQAMGRDWLHYMTKTLIGPMLQLVILAISGIAAGLLGIYAREAVLKNLTFYYMLVIVISDTLFGGVLRKMFTPLNETRIAIYSGIDLTFNYFFISKFGLGFILFLEGLK